MVVQGDQQMARTTKQTKTPAAPGFAVEIKDDTELGLAILVAEFGDGNYQPGGGNGEHQRGARDRRQRHARTDVRPRARRDAELPRTYMVWAQGIEGEYIIAATIQP